MTYIHHSPFAENTRRNATLRNVSQSIFLRKEIALLRKVVGESACYTCIYVSETKRRITRFKVRKALNNKSACVFITCKRNFRCLKRYKLDVNQYPLLFFFCCFNSCFKGQFWVSYSLWIVDNLKHRSM